MRTSLFLAAVLLLGGCAALPPQPLHSAWYVHYESADAKAEPKIYVALLNRSGRTLEVEEVVVNRSSTDDSPAWRWDTSKTPYKLEPGRLLTVPAIYFTRETVYRRKKDQLDMTKCILPVDISVVVSPASRRWIEEWVTHVPGDPRGAIRTDLVGRMPSSLPEGWDTRCGPPGSTQQAASPPR